MLRSILTILWWSLPAAAFAQPGFEFCEPVRPARAVQVMAHRGLWRTAPANSVPAVLAAHSDYIEWVSVDVRLTRDGQHVISATDALDEVSDHSGSVASLSLAELHEFDIGVRHARRFEGLRLASLPDLLAAAKDRVNVCLRIARGDAARLVREIQTAGMERQVVVTGTDEFLSQVRDAAGPAVARMPRFQPDRLPLAELIEKVAPAAVELEPAEVTADICRACRAAGVKVQAQLIVPAADHPDVWRQMLEAGVDWLLTDDPAAVRFFEVRRRIPRFPVQIACHRGENREAPENSLPAIQRAAALGADYIEIDIRTTADGQWVLLHDRTLNRTTNGTGPVQEFAWADLAMLDAGAWFGRPYAGTRIPRLDEGLVALGPGSHAYLDAKAIEPSALIAAIHKHDLLQRHVVYQSLDYCRALKKLEPGVRLLPALKQAADLPQVVEAQAFGVDAAWNSLSADLIERCHRAGLQVFSDALGTHETVADYRCVMGWGIDVIQTDHPLRVLRAIELQTSPAPSPVHGHGAP